MKQIRRLSDFFVAVIQRHQRQVDAWVNNKILINLVVNILYRVFPYHFLLRHQVFGGKPEQLLAFAWRQSRSALIDAVAVVAVEEIGTWTYLPLPRS